jgi:hypothetical protein
MKQHSKTDPKVSRSVASSLAGNKSRAPVQRVKAEGGPVYATRTDERSGKASMKVKLDGNLDPAAGAEAQDTLTLSREEMLPIVPKGDEPLTAMHLLNEKLGGTGADVHNLAWGSKRHNEKHFNGIEKEVQEIAQDENYKEHILEYSTTPQYHSDNPADAGKPIFYFLKTVTSGYTITDPEGKKTGENMVDVHSDGIVEDNDQDFVIPDIDVKKIKPKKNVVRRTRSQKNLAGIDAPDKSEIEFDQERLAKAKARKEAKEGGKKRKRPVDPNNPNPARKKRKTK